MYIPLRRLVSLRSAEWCTVCTEKSTRESTGYTEAHIKIKSEFKDKIIYGEKKVELQKIHVDYLSPEEHTKFRAAMLHHTKHPGEFLFPIEVFKEMLEKDGCQFRHNPAVCRCHLPVILLGQDESAYKEFSYSKKIWKVNGVSKLRPKNDGKSLMISAFQSAYRGFGFDLTKEELVVVNNYRRIKFNRPPLVSSPGFRFLNMGKNNEGYWDYEQFKIQVTDMMDTVEALYGDMQIAFEVDHSSNHLKKKEDGLDVGAMNLYYGGKQRTCMRNTIVTADCLGNEPGRSLNPGDTQHMNFREGDDINIYKGNKPNEYDTKVPKEKKNQDGTKTQQEHTIEGYIGKPKGIYQVLYERGLWKKGMKGKETNADIAKNILKGKTPLPLDLSAEIVLANCQDFREELSALEELITSRGHILIKSPKCHPEIAGAGIEYSWGKSKMFYARNNHHTKTVKMNEFKDRVLAALSKEVLTMERIWAYERRTRDYCRLYSEVDEKVAQKIIKREDIDYTMLEKQRKIFRSHRNIKEIERKFIDSI